MGFFKWMDSRVKTFSVWDIGILKICVISFALMVAKLWPPLLALDWKVYGLVFLISYLYLVYIVYMKK